MIRHADNGIGHHGRHADSRLFNAPQNNFPAPIILLSKSYQFFFVLLEKLRLLKFDSGCALKSFLKLRDPVLSGCIPTVEVAFGLCLGKAGMLADTLHDRIFGRCGLKERTAIDR